MIQRLATALALSAALAGCAGIHQPDRSFDNVDLVIPTRDSHTIHQMERTLVLDQDVLDYVNDIRQRLETAHGTPCNCQVVVDAFSGYEGYAVSPYTIVVTAGVLAQADSEDEVAALIAHEMSHAIHDDTTKQWMQEAVASTLRLGALVAGGSDNVGYAALIGESAHEATNGIIYRHWNAEHELQADAFAVEVLAKAGYSQDGVKMMIRRLGEYSEQAIAGRSTPPSQCVSQQGDNNLAVDFRACTAQLTGSGESIYLPPQARLEAALEHAWELPPQQRRQRAAPPPPSFDAIDYLYAMNALVFSDEDLLRNSVEAMASRPLPASLEGNVSVSNRMAQAYYLLGEYDKVMPYWEQSASSPQRTPWTFTQQLKLADQQRDRDKVRQLLNEMSDELGMVPAMLPAEYYLARRYELRVHEGLTLARCALNLAGSISTAQLCSEYGQLANRHQPLNW
ncbi:hypothetical protein BWR19_10085 [Halomonas sp. 1513]|nr:hypothetical protein BWR19_10085 [Halomonas sp. 1513]